MSRTYICINKTIARTVENPGLSIIHPKRLIKHVKKVRCGYVAVYDNRLIKIHDDSWKNFWKYQGIVLEIKD